MIDVGVAHDYLTQRGGAERVALYLARGIGKGRLVTAFWEPRQTYPVGDVRVATSPWNRIRCLRADPRRALPVLPTIWRGMRAPQADVWLCSSSGWSHRLTTSGVAKVVYCHNVPRWLYLADDYWKGRNPVARYAGAEVGKRFRSADRDRAAEAAAYIANSVVVSERIAECYGREAVVIPPPLTYSADGPMRKVEGLPEEFVLSVARDRAYKNTSFLLEVANRLSIPLVVVGGLARGRLANVEFVGKVKEASLRWLYAKARMLLAASNEDFGLTVIEANSHGKPVVAWRHGGYLETVIEGVTGILFDTLDVDVAWRAMREAEHMEWDSQLIVKSTQRFAPEIFRERIWRVLESQVGGDGKGSDGVSNDVERTEQLTTSINRPRQR